MVPVKPGVRDSGEEGPGHCSSHAGRAVGRVGENRRRRKRAFLPGRRPRLQRQRPQRISDGQQPFRANSTRYRLDQYVHSSSLRSFFLSSLLSYTCSLFPIHRFYLPFIFPVAPNKHDAFSGGVLHCQESLNFFFTGWNAHDDEI